MAHVRRDAAARLPRPPPVNNRLQFGHRRHGCGSGADTGGLADALLLLGPTGSGKTPLGEELAARGLGGRRCLHFDFGFQLRSVASGSLRIRWLTPAHTATIRRVLRTGELLKDRDFPIAKCILDAFLKRNHYAPGDGLILNGLPRHVGQARGLRNLVRVRGVVRLTASAEVIRRRIERNVGGDRSGRGDDTPSHMARRLRIYERRTAPLVIYYRRQGVPVLTLRVGASMTARQMSEMVMRGASIFWTRARETERAPRVAPRRGGRK